MNDNFHCFDCNDLANIDESIFDLVFILNFLGIETLKSCEGHLGGICHPFPWVAIKEKDINRVEKLLEDFNKDRKVRWKVKIDANSKKWLLRSEISANGKKSLYDLQKSNKELAKFLSKKATRKEHPR